MKIRFDPWEERGSLLQKAGGLKETQDKLTANSIVLTGANGSGKSVLLDGLAFAAGLGSRYSSSETQCPYSSIEMSDLEKTHRGVSLHHANGKKIVFDRVLRFRGDEVRSRPISMDAMEDFALVMSAPGSHGETNQNKMGGIFRNMVDFTKDEKGRILVLLDEPEAGMGMDVVFRLTETFENMCRRAIELRRMVAVIATQSPFLVAACREGGATRLDLGGWLWGDPMELFEGVGDQLVDQMREKWRAKK